MLLFHAAWSEQANVAYAAWNDDTSHDDCRPMPSDRLPSLPEGLRSELDTNPFNASASLIDFLVADAGLAADGAAEGEPSPPKRRPKRTKAQIAEDEGKIAGHLIENPTSTRDEAAKATGVAAAHVSRSHAWRHHVQQRKLAREANRAARRGIGGVGDPTTDVGGD